MTYRVAVTRRAKEDLRHYFLLASEHAPQTALDWLARFESTLESLASNPERCSLAPENNLVEDEIRQLFVGKMNRRFRALFTIREDEVLVLHVRRGTMSKATAEDLGER
jgi:plasmid stabilization system protein ParE